jgi:hypothetical protein
MNKEPLLVVLILVASVAYAQTSKVDWWALDGGYAAPASSTTMIKSAVGQVFVATTQGASSIVKAGFLADTLFRKVVTGVPLEAGGIPKEYSLSQNYPNPFNPTTIIRFGLPHASRVSLKIYDVLGQEVATLVNEEKPAGVYDVRFNAAGLASGMYVYQLQAGDFVQTRRLLLLK